MVVGDDDGKDDTGLTVGLIVDEIVGTLDGVKEGFIVGELVGILEGDNEGLIVGD